MDEVKLQEEPNPYYRWSQRGVTPVDQVTRLRRSVSFYGGIFQSNGKHLGYQCDWQNSNETCQFLDQVAKYHRDQRTTRPILLIWDNASWHKSKRVKQWLKDNPGIVKLMNFPPYSPNLNPQEHVWKLLRQHLSTFTETYAFSEIVDKACHFLRTNTFKFKLI